MKEQGIYIAIVYTGMWFGVEVTLDQDVLGVL